MSPPLTRCTVCTWREPEPPAECAGRDERPCPLAPAIEARRRALQRKLGTAGVTRPVRMYEEVRAHG